MRLPVIAGLVFLLAGPAIAASPYRYMELVTPVPGNAFSVNSVTGAGAVVGSYTKAGTFAERHGYIQDSQGQVTTIDVPEARVGVATSGTSPIGVNAAGTICGFFMGMDALYHGFLRDPAGRFTRVDHPSGVRGTVLHAVDAAGAVIGDWTDAQQNSHVFLMSPQGEFRPIEPPNSVQAFPGGMTDDGRIVGQFYDRQNKAHGFLRDASGTFTAIDYPGAVGTMLTGINSTGQISGWYNDKAYHRSGFVREANGSFVPISPPGAVSDIEVHGIGPTGQIVGSYVGRDQFRHEFTALPNR